MANMPEAKSTSADRGNVAGVFQLPNFDFEAMVVSQRETIEALMEVNKIAIEGFQAVMLRQFESGRQAMDVFSMMVRDLGQPSVSAADRVAKQAEYSRQVVEKGLSNVREIGELVTKTSTEASNIINKRLTKGLDEVRDYSKKHVATV